MSCANMQVFSASATGRTGFTRLQPDRAARAATSFQSFITLHQGGPGLISSTSHAAAKATSLLTLPSSQSCKPPP